MVEGRESVKQGSVLDGGSFKTTVALAEGRASEIRCIVAMATLEVNPVSVCVCVCVCVCVRVCIPRAGQSRSSPSSLSSQSMDALS